MSGADHPITPGSDFVPEVDDGSNIGNEESPPAPVTTSPLKDNPTGAEDSNPESKSLLPPADVSARPTNGDSTPSKTTSAATEKQNKNAGMATPPRCNSPCLFQLLSTPPRGRTQSPRIVTELQAAVILPREVANRANVLGAVKDAIVESGIVPEVKASIGEGDNVSNESSLNFPLLREHLRAPLPAMGTIPGGNVSKVVPDAAAVKGGVPEVEKMETSEERQPPQATGDEELQTSDPTLTEDSSNFKKPAVSTRIQDMKGRLQDIKLTSVPEPTKRRSERLMTKHAHSESPSPKKERKSAPTLERTPSKDKMTLRTRGHKERLGSTSSNSEVEGSGDEGRGKRVSRKDSKK